MSLLEALARWSEWATKDAAHNLDFVPVDKLMWKPAPTAKSVLEIVNEMICAARGMMMVLQGGDFPPVPPAFPPAIDTATAKELLLSTGRDYARALRAVDAQELGRPVDLGFGTYPLAQAAAMAVVEFVHHRGQIVYIQTLLGDSSDHFDLSAL